MQVDEDRVRLTTDLEAASDQQVLVDMERAMHMEVQYAEGCNSYGIETRLSQQEWKDPFLKDKRTLLAITARLQRIAWVGMPLEKARCAGPFCSDADATFM